MLGEGRRVCAKRTRDLLGWFWEPQGLILEPPGLVLPIFLYFSRPSILSSLLSSLFSSLFFLSFLVYVIIFILSCLFSLLSSPFSFRSSLRSFQRRGGFRVANWDPPRRCHVRAARNGVSDQGLRSLALRKRMLPLTRHETLVSGIAAET